MTALEFPTAILNTTFTDPNGQVWRCSSISPVIWDKVSDYAPILSPNFLGIPTAPTATLGNDTQQIATTAFVKANSVVSVEDKADKVAPSADNNLALLNTTGNLVDSTTNISDVCLGGTNLLDGYANENLLVNGSCVSWSRGTSFLNDIGYTADNIYLPYAGMSIKRANIARSTSGYGITLGQQSSAAFTRLLRIPVEMASNGQQPFGNSEEFVFSCGTFSQNLGGLYAKAFFADNVQGDNGNELLHVGVGTVVANDYSNLSTSFSIPVEEFMSNRIFYLEIYYLKDEALQDDDWVQLYDIKLESGTVKTKMPENKTSATIAECRRYIPYVFETSDATVRQFIGMGMVIGNAVEVSVPIPSQAKNQVFTIENDLTFVAIGSGGTYSVILNNVDVYSKRSGELSLMFIYSDLPPQTQSVGIFANSVSEGTSGRLLVSCEL